MAISKIILNGQTQMDVTGKTVTAGSMLDGATSLKNDGTDIVGSIPSKSAYDLTVNGATVTAPAGHYAIAASKTIPNADASAATPSFSYTTENGVRKWGFTYEAYAESAGYVDEGPFGTQQSYKYNAIAKNTSVTPTESAQTIGGADTMMEGAVTINAIPSNYVGSGITQQAAQTIHPSTTDRTIASGKYLTGAQTIKGVQLTNLLATNIKKDVVVKVGDSTDDDCVTSITGTFEGQVPSGIKYIWTPVDGQGPWNTSGFASCAVDGVPINDNKGRIWIQLTDNLSVSINLTLYSSSAAGVVDWGDGTQGTWDSTNRSAVAHTYNSGGIYVIEFAQTSGTAGWAFNTNALGQASNNRNNTVIAVEHYMSSYLSSHSAFKYCNNLKRITYTGIAQTIAAGELDGSQSLEIVTFPSTVSQLGNYTFRNCTALREVHIAATTPPTLRTDVFLNTPSTMIIYVPYSSDHSVLSAYQTAWANLAEQIQEESI